MAGIIDRTDKVLIIGPSKCGKTVLVKHFMRQADVPYFVYDTQGQFGEISSFNRFQGIDWKLKAIAYRPYLEAKDPVKHYDAVLNALFIKGGRIIVTDEVQEFVKPNAMPYWKSNCVKQGRHRRIGTWDLAQDFTGLSPIIRQAQHVICFRTAWNRATDEEADRILPNASDGRPASELMHDLKPYEFIWWAKGNPKFQNRIFRMGPIHI